jgi:ribosomal-protein-alanine N-acetyltransferase
MSVGGISIPVPVLTRYDLIPMTRSHLDAVLAIERSSYTTPWTRDSFEHEIEENPFSRPVVATSSDDETEVAGYCVSWIVFEHLYIHNVAVHPGHRRRGIACALLLHALSRGREFGAQVARLEVRPSNRSALRLYRSLGFQNAGIRRNHYTRPPEDALLLSRALAP